MAENDPAPDLDPVPTHDPPKADDPIKPDDDWQAKARKHERDLKRERKAREDLEAKLAERTEADKSEVDKALDKAREDAKAEAKAEAAKEFRGRILQSEIRAHAAGKYADPDDAIKLLDLDDDEAFGSDGEVQTAVLESALDDLLKRKPHLGATGGRPAGDPDGGKGTGSATGTPEERHGEFLAALLRQPR